MKTSKIVEVYSILNTVKLTGMDTKAKMSVLENLRLLKPIAEGFKSEMETAQEKLKPEGFDAIAEKANQHNEAVNEGKEEGKMSAAELSEANKLFRAYNKDLEARSKELEAVENEISLKPLAENEFEKLASVNDLEAGKLVVLYEALCVAV